MNTTKNTLFMAGVIVFAVVLTAAGILLIRGILQLSGTEKDLQARSAELSGLYSGNPFPSPGNVQRETENGQTLLEWFKKLLGLSRKGQVQPSKPSPSNFMSLLGDRRAELSLLATNNNVALARDFAFGFDRYFAAGSTPPAPEEVPRLAEQLSVVSQLSTVLFEERISALMGIAREEAESPAGTTGSAAGKRRTAGRASMQGPAVAGAGLIGKDALFGKLHFVVDMRAREKALMGVLNRLASGELFVVVSGITMEKDGNDVRAVTKAADSTNEDAPAEAPAAKKEPPPRSERIVSGSEVERLMKIVLDIDVYRFPEQ